MKNHLILTSLAIIACGLIGTASAQTLHTPPHLEHVQYVAPGPVFTGSCAVNGVIYGVDAYSLIWGQNVVGDWVVIGRIIATPYGYFAIDRNGRRFPALCQ